MKLVVVSDSHGLREPLQKIIDENLDADFFLHCGDICLDTDEFERYITVQGNNDYYDYPLEMSLNLGNHQLLMLHSHMVSYFQREDKLVNIAKQGGYDIVLFGHTHVAMHKVIEGIHLINPGSLYHSRDGRPPSYAIIDINDQNQEVRVHFIYLK